MSSLILVVLYIFGGRGYGGYGESKFYHGGDEATVIVRLSPDSSEKSWT